MRPLLRRALALLPATLLTILLAVPLTWCTTPPPTPTPEPLPLPLPSPTVTEALPSGPGAGALGQVTVSVPATVGTSVTWTAATFVSLTSASPATYSSTDTITVWGSSTGAEVTAPGGGYIAQGWVSGTSWAWSSPPTTWTAWPYYAVTRQTTGTMRSLYLNGNSGSGSSGGSDAGTNIGVVTVNGESSPVITTGLVDSIVLKSSAGVHVSTLVQVDATAPSTTYYVLMIQGSASCPVDGSVTLLHAPITVVHTNGTPNTVVFNDSGSPAPFSTGLCVALSSTQFTKTSAGLSYLVADGSVL